MRIARTILVTLVALAVATLPAAAGLAVVLPTSNQAADVSSEAMPDCAHHHAVPADQRQKPASDGASMAGCAVHCFSFAGFAAATVAVLPAASAALEPVRVSDGAPSHMGLPPFRPPRA